MASGAPAPLASNAPPTHASAPAVTLLVKNNPPGGAGACTDEAAKLAAAGVNRPDLLQRQGHYPPPEGASDIPGLEVAGRIAARGDGVTEWRDGDEVCALVAGGGYAEYCVAPAVQCLRVPKGLTLVEAAALPETVRTQLRDGLRQLEEEIWQAADKETEAGIACNTGQPGCVEGHPGRMTVVEERWQDEARRIQLLREVVLPSWVQRCGPDCGQSWNRFVAPSLGLWAMGE